ncbi:tetratricopeptide repeat-containing hybrid sensor histidine kinase/response regulator [Winogradskyella psychrotolerans]|uniref:tetratricopeptide repeat-containing hybrid sensor histidine kinase/response regulator n=1 Tax=Winogradskyella psychrotolerans TaxID=1344585 RepID=UPI001C078054|nr:response regulator [Winogradskyella psychrotolerans]MBU2928543.1 response regulator [Winogradskyella psychrotolerans]
MRILLLTLTFIVLHNSSYTQKNETNPDDILNATETKVTAHIDSIKSLMMADFYKEDYSSTIIKAKRLIEYKEINKYPEKVAEIRSYIANSYMRLNDSVRSLEYANKNIALGKELNDSNIILGSQIDLGNIYLTFNKIDEALNSLKTALPLATETNDETRLFILNYNITEIYLEYLNDYKGSTPYLKAAEKYAPKTFIVGLAGINLFKAHYAFQEKDYQLASIYYQEAIDLAKESNHTEVLKKGYHGYIECLSQKGDYKKAYEIGKIKDSLSVAQSKLEIEKSAKTLKTSLENSRKQEELKTEALRNELIIEKSETHRKLLIFSAIVSLILLSLLSYLLKVTKNRRKLNIELKLKNQEYLEAKLESEKLAEAKSRFLSTMSHELRTPLYGIIGLSTVLNNDSNLKSHKTELQSLKFSADYLLNLVNDVLTLNKMDSDEKIKFESKPFHLKDFLNNIKESLEYLTRQTNNELIITLNPKIPNWITGDQTKMSQVLINLLGNALKFTSNGKVELIVSLLDIKEKDIKLKFEVKDNGLGIPIADQKKIFEEFGQLKNEGDIQGSGLGLTIVQKLLIDMKSNIQLESVVNEGSNFFFDITFGITQKNHVSKDTHDDVSIEILRGKKILVVDDNRINLMVTKKTLESHDIIVDIATNGQEGIDKIMLTDYDLVLMDVHMPIMDGIEATKELRKLQKPVIVIALTAVTQDEQDNRFKSAQFNDSIVKPYKVNEFIKTLASNLVKKPS